MYEVIQHVINGLAAGTIYALVALGYTMVYGVLKLINFAHGDVMMVGVYVGYAVAFYLSRDPTASHVMTVGIGGVLGPSAAKIALPLVVMAVSMIACAGLGFFIERFAYRPLREKPRLTALITAIGISFALSYGFQLDLSAHAGAVALTLAVLALAFVVTWRLGPVLARTPAFRDRPRLASFTVMLTSAITLGVLAHVAAASVTAWGPELTILPGASARRFPEIIKPEEWIVLGDNDVIIWNWQVISLGIALTLMGALQYLVYRTRFGKAMRAVSWDHRVAGLMGIPVDRVIGATFMLGSALAAGAGILYAIKDKSVQPLMGMYVGLKAFIAAVIGGIGNLPGAVVGALLLGLCEEFVVGYTQSSWRDAVAFGFLIIVLLFRPEGLFGRAQAEKV